VQITNTKAEALKNGERKRQECGNKSDKADSISAVITKNTPTKLRDLVGVSVKAKAKD